VIIDHEFVHHNHPGADVNMRREKRRVAKSQQANSVVLFLTQQLMIDKAK
jgi:hypothetical protein